jgi:hypothetical protein
MREKEGETVRQSQKQRQRWKEKIIAKESLERRVCA